MSALPAITGCDKLNVAALGNLVPHPTEKVLEGSLGILELDAAAGNGKPTSGTPT